MFWLNMSDFYWNEILQRMKEYDFECRFVGFWEKNRFCGYALCLPDKSTKKFYLGRTSEIYKEPPNAPKIYPELTRVRRLRHGASPLEEKTSDSF